MIRASWRRPSAPGAYQAGSSPPSPVLAAPPARWMPIVSAWWASGLKRADAHRRDHEAAHDRRGRPRPRRAGRASRARRTRSSSRGTERSDAAGRAPRGSAASARVDAPARCRRSADRATVISLGDPRREEVGLAVGAEAGEARVRQARLAARRRLGAMAAPPRARRSWRSARSAKVVRPGHAAAVGKQRATTDASRSTTSISAPPMYEATALMPIRASVLRRPASKAGDEAADGRRRASASRRRACRPARRPARSRAAAGRPVAPTARTIAMRMDVEDVGGVDHEVGPAAQAGLGQRRVDGAGAEDRRDRQPVERERRGRTGRRPPRRRGQPRRHRARAGRGPARGHRPRPRRPTSRRAP